MKRLLVSGLLVIAGCGGGSEFDGNAVRRHLVLTHPGATTEQIAEVVDAVRESCESDDDAFEFVVAMAVDGGDIERLELGCPKRTQAVLDDFTDQGIID